MTELDCQNICMAAMAVADGHQPDISPDQIELHVAHCSACREEFAQLSALSSFLGKQQRKAQFEDLWTGIAERTPDARLAKSVGRSWHPFVILALLLLGYKLVEMIPNRDFGVLYKLVPILLVVAAFGYIKENPFKINAELGLESGD